MISVMEIMCILFQKSRRKAGFTNNMPKTIFHTTEKSNFILNMDLDKYRAFCTKLLAAMLMLIGASALIYQLTYSVNTDLNAMLHSGGFGSFVAFIAITLRSVATFFSTFGVFAIIAMVIAMMRKQFSRKTALPYLLTLAGLLWAVPSILCSFSYTDSLFGQDGRDEGWFALLIYAALLYVASMLRRREHLQLLLNLVLGLGLFQCAWALLQTMPFFDFPNEYNFVGPMLYQNLRLPSGLTDSPITFAMLLTMLVCIAIPAAIRGESQRQRVFATVCAGLDMLLLLKTQTIAGCIGAIVGLLLAVVLWAINRKKSTGKTWILPVTVVSTLLLSGVWTYFAPTLNGTYKTYNDEPLPNGFVLCDSGIVWDDGFYRLSTASPYSSMVEHDFDIYDAGSVISYCWSEGVRAIQKYPLLGTGPDNFWYLQLRTSMNLMSNANGVDRPYNDFLYIAATRGIPALLLYLALLIVCLMQGLRHRKQTGSWVYGSAACAVIGYVATAMVGISVLTVTPLLWILLGVLVGEPLTDAPKTDTVVAPSKKTKRKRHSSAS